MARFRVYQLKQDKTFALDVQADLLSDLETRAVVPLVPAGSIQKIFPRLNPIFEIEAQKYIMATQFAGVVPTRELGPVVADLTKQSDEITVAMDFLLQGF